MKELFQYLEENRNVDLPLKYILLNNLPFKKDYYICDDLDINHKNVYKLPKGLYVKGSLDISYTKINKLPKNLKVENYLNIAGTSISELPKGLQDFIVVSTIDLNYFRKKYPNYGYFLLGEDYAYDNSSEKY